MRSKTINVEDLQNVAGQKLGRELTDEKIILPKEKTDY